MPFSRRRVLAALGSTALMPLVAGEAFGSSQSASDRTFVKLARGTVDQWMKFSPVWATQIGDHRFDDEIENVGAEGRNASLAFAKATLAALQLIDHTKLSRANQVDAALLSNALRFQIWSTETLQDWAWNPLYYQNIAGSAIYNLMAREFAPVKKRLAAATKRLGLIPALLKQARSELVPARVPAPHAETYSQQNKGLKSIIDEMIKPHLGSVSGETRKHLNSAIAVYKIGRASCRERVLVQV